MLRKVLMLFIRGYQRFVSPFTPPRCRFQPTCSHYAMDALEQYGALKGTWLTIRRVLKCHPLHPGGWDPVPDPLTGKKAPLEDESEATQSDNSDVNPDPYADKDNRGNTR